MKSAKAKRITLVAQRAFVAELKDAVVEKDVESAYKTVFRNYYETTFPSPYGSDGYIEQKQASLLDEGLRLLLEVKFGLELTRSQDRAKIVAQAIYYLKKFELDGKPLPNVIVGGDENQIFTVYAPKLKTYLEKPYDWSLAPSSAWRENEKLYRELLDDPNLNVFVFDVRSSAFDINEVFRSIDALSHQNSEFNKLRVSESNIRKVFDEFVRVVFGGDNWLIGVKKIGAQETVSIFIQSILGNPDIYIVPTKRNVLHLAGGKEISINAGNYDAFFSRYDRKYTISEIDTITAIADQLIEEIVRRLHGDFWTPTIWADRAVEMIGNSLGDDWRKKYVVWDPAAGTKNLTRDYTFDNLFSSTIHQAEIDMSRQYNQKSTVFQYDFLNDDVDVSPESDPRDLKMPQTLFDALKDNRPIIFYTNPPYGQATEQGATSKGGIASTKIGDLMRANDLGLASAELYTQFFYRVQKLVKDFGLTEVHVFFFHKAFLISPAFEKFTNQLLEQFTFKNGFMINAGEFEGTSSAWGIVFSHLFKATKSSVDQVKFKVSVEGSSDRGILKLGEHNLRKISKTQTISSWLAEIKLTTKEFNDGHYPRVTGGFNLSKGKTIAGFLREGAIGFMHNGGVSVQFSNKYTNLNTTMNYVDHGVSVTPENFERVCVTFACRKSILPKATWVNDKDIFRRPSDEFQRSKEWAEFVKDCVVYSLFQGSSYQSSLRNFEYKGEFYDVANEWFFMPRDEVMSLAQANDLSSIVYDARSSDERFVYQYLAKSSLSQEAKDLLDAGKELIRQTFPKRFLADSENPNWHLMTWDASYLQVYKITTMFKSDYKEFMGEFNQVFKKLEDKIRDFVYKDEILEK